MTFLLVLGGVAGAVAAVALVSVGVWVCTGECLFVTSLQLSLRRKSER